MSQAEKTSSTRPDHRAKARRVYFLDMMQLKQLDLHHLLSKIP